MLLHFYSFVIHVVEQVFFKEKIRACLESAFHRFLQVLLKHKNPSTLNLLAKSWKCSRFGSLVKLIFWKLKVFWAEDDWLSLTKYSQLHSYLINFNGSWMKHLIETGPHSLRAQLGNYYLCRCASTYKCNPTENKRIIKDICTKLSKELHRNPLYWCSFTSPFWR